MNKAKKYILGTVLSVCVLIAIILSLLLAERGEGMVRRQNTLADIAAHPEAYAPDSLSIICEDHKLANEIADSLGGSLSIREGLSCGTITLPLDKTVYDAIASVDYRYLEYIAPNPYVYPDEITSDALMPFNERLGTGAMNLGDTWNTTTGGGVRIAVIDSGIDWTHEEFQGRISDLSYSVSLKKTVRENDGDYSILKSTGTQHGTQVAGIVAAAANNGKGVAGVAYDCELVIIKLTDTGGTYNAAEMMEGVEYAANIGCDVAVLSMGTYSYIPGCDTVISKAVQSGTIIVCAAGNESTTEAHYPSSCKDAISVGALAAATGSKPDSYYTFPAIADYSNYGTGRVDIMAPGTWWTTTDSQLGISSENDTYGWYGCASGTSFAAPAAASAIALYISAHPDANVATVKRALFASCRDIGDGGYDPVYGYGMIDIETFVGTELVALTFNTNSESDKTTRTVYVPKGSFANDIPVMDSVDGLIFNGWHLDPECTEKIEPLTYVFTQDTTVYAGWDTAENVLPYDLRCADPYMTVVRLIRKAGNINSYTACMRAAHFLNTAFPDGNYAGHPSDIRECLYKAGINVNLDECVAVLNETTPSLSVKAYIGTDTVYSIPSEADGKNVVSIAIDAFKGKRGTVAVIPDGVIYIGNGAFSEMKSLSWVQIPKSVLIVAKDAFASSPATVYVEAAEASDGWKYRGYIAAVVTGGNYKSKPNAYDWDSGTKEVVYSAIRKQNETADVLFIGDTCTLISYYGPETELVLNSFDGYELVGIDEAAFENNTTLTSITLSDSVKSVGARVFAGCTSLEFADIRGTDEMGASAFEGCESLKTVLLCPTLQTIPRNAFRNCASLYNFCVPENDTLTSIESGAFCGCVSLDRMSLLGCHALTEIGAAFDGCTALEMLALPTSVTSVAKNALHGCTSLAWLEMPFAGGSASQTNGYLSYLFGNTDDIPATLKTLVITRSTPSTVNTFEGLEGCEVWLLKNIPSASFRQDNEYHYRDSWYGATLVYENIPYLTLPVLSGQTPDARDALYPAPGGKTVTAYTSLGDDRYALSVEDRTYTVTYTDRGGETLATFENLSYGDALIPPSVEAVEITDYAEYTFVGWSDTSLVATRDTVITPNYTQRVREYEIIVTDGQGRSAKRTLHFGDPIPALPSYTENGYRYDFVFDGDEAPTVTGNATVTGHFMATQLSYTVTFLGKDGESISQETYHYGDTLQVPTPPTYEDPTYIYTFSGWDKELAETVTGNRTYNAIYSKDYINYTVRFENADGTVISEKTYHYGEKPKIPENPEKETDKVGSYTFTGWSADVLPVSENVTYVAQYDTAYHVYHVSFRNDDGTVLKEDDYRYGDMPEVPDDPEKYADKMYIYTFSGWDKTVEAVTSDTVYTATYSTQDVLYTVTFVDENGAVLETLTCRYGEVPQPVICDGKTWQTPLIAVTENTTYVAAADAVSPVLIIVPCVVALSGAIGGIGFVLLRKKQRNR